MCCDKIPTEKDGAIQPRPVPHNLDIGQETDHEVPEALSHLVRAGRFLRVARQQRARAGERRRDSLGT